MKFLVTCSLMLAMTGAAAAQESDSGAGEGTPLEPILITGGRTPIEQEKSGRAFTVITGEELEQRQIRYVADALRLVPGFSVSRTGSAGGHTQIRIRGAEANHLLVMIDGIEVSETSSGEFDFGSLIVHDIDRIEVLRGPQSAFWGSNATAGVVNIITKRGERNGWQTSAKTEAGTDGTFFSGASLSGGEKNYDLALSAAFRRNDGFNISDFGDEKDGVRNTTLNGKAFVDLTPNLTLDGTIRYVDRKSDTDPQDFLSGLVLDANDWTATEEVFGSLGATFVSLGGALTQKARFTGSDVYREGVDNGFFSWNDGSRYNGTYQATYDFSTPALLAARHKLTGGYEWERETFLPSHLEERLERETNSLIGEYRGEFLDQLYLSAAIREDRNDGFENATTYSISGAWRIPNSETRLHASVGTGVTNPTFFEQFGFTPSVFEGNPNLTPEKSFGWDVGIEQGFFGRRLVVDVTYFNQNLTDEIALVMGDELLTVINRSGESLRQGIEVSATINLANGFMATATYTYTDATEQTVAGGPRLDELRRPQHAGSLSASYVFFDDRARIFGEAVFNGEMEDNSFVPGTPPRVTLDSYTVVNIGGSFKFTENLEGFGRVENLFDEEYEEVFGYNTPGRIAYIGLRGKF